jgi:hypothetical protein
MPERRIVLIHQHLSYDRTHLLRSSPCREKVTQFLLQQVADLTLRHGSCYIERYGRNRVTGQIGLEHNLAYLRAIAMRQDDPIAVEYQLSQLGAHAAYICTLLFEGPALTGRQDRITPEGYDQ